MAANYLPYEPGQMLLLPGAIQDWLPEGHLAHFISDTVDTLELSAFHARYAEPPNRWIKKLLGFRQFSVRGLQQVTAEWKLVCLALNLRRMATMAAG